MGLSPDGFGKLTPGEYRAKRQGFMEHQSIYLKQQAWLIGAMAGRGVGSSQENPYPDYKEVFPEEE
jgi:hypothetical protein